MQKKTSGIQNNKQGQGKGRVSEAGCRTPPARPGDGPEFGGAEGRFTGNQMEHSSPRKEGRSPWKKGEGCCLLAVLSQYEALYHGCFLISSLSSQTSEVDTAIPISQIRKMKDKISCPRAHGAWTRTRVMVFVLQSMLASVMPRPVRNFARLSNK